MENRQKIAFHPTELSLFPWELTDRKITKTHKEISNIPDSKPTGKSINLTVADNVLDPLTLIFFVTHLSKKYRQENISVGRLTGKFYFCVNLSLMGYACRAPDIINFSDYFSHFLDGFWHIGKMVFPVVYALLCMLFSQNITYAIVQILNILHCAPCNDPNSLHPMLSFFDYQGKSPTKSPPRFLMGYARQDIKAPCENPRVVIVRLAPGVKENLYMD